MTTRDHGPDGLVLMRGEHTDIVTVRNGTGFASCSASMALALGGVPVKAATIPLTPDQLQWLTTATGAP